MTKRFTLRTVLLALGVLVLGVTAQSHSAYAVCSNPAGDTGEQVYNSTHNLMQFCNGSDWIAMASDGDTVGNLSCSDGEIAKWNNGGSVWECATDTDTDTDTLASLSCSSGEVAEWNGSAWACATPSSGGGAAGDYQVFAADGTWTKPAGLSDEQLIIVELWGGGGGGAYNRLTLRAVDLGATETVTVGAGGGISTKGGNTSFGTHGTAYGGGTTSTGGGGGGGGIGSAGSNANSLAGGSGGGPGGGFTVNGDVATDSSFGGGGGGYDNDSGGDSAWGGGGGGGGEGDGGNSAFGGGGGGGDNGNGGTSIYGGNGGGEGVNGSIPGGGGGRNASGARGEVRVWVIPAGGGGGGGGSDTLAGLSCSSGEVAEWNGSAWVCASNVGGGGSSFTCPSGFTMIESSGYQLGCMQDTEDGSANYNTAVNACFNDHGGTLPSLAMAKIAFNNYALTDETDDNEWVNNAINSDNAGVIKSNGSGGNSGTGSTNAYRCFIPASGGSGGGGGGTEIDLLDPYATNSSTSVAHGLGAMPSSVIWYLENKTAEFGYSVGDRIYQLGPNISPFSVSSDATNVTASTVVSTLPTITQKGGFTGGTITAANWKLGVIVNGGSGGGGSDTLAGLSCSDGQVAEWDNTGGAWVCATASGTDNLGDHTATQDVDVASNDIINIDNNIFNPIAGDAPITASGGGGGISYATDPNGYGYFVLSSFTTDGNLGGMDGANAMCVNELMQNNFKGRPGFYLDTSKIYAFLCDSGGCNNLQPSTTYVYASAYDNSGGANFTTDGSGVGPNYSGGADWDDATKLGPAAGDIRVWTGRSTGTASLWGTTAHSNRCSNWTSNSSGNDGRIGKTSRNNAERWSEASESCAQTKRIICVLDP